MRDNFSNSKNDAIFVWSGILLVTLTLGFLLTLFLKPTIWKWSKNRPERLRQVELPNEQREQEEREMRSRVQKKLQDNIKESETRQKEIQLRLAEVEEGMRELSDTVAQIQHEQLIEKKRGKEYVLYYLMGHERVGRLARQYLGEDFLKQRQVYTSEMQKTKIKNE